MNILIVEDDYLLANRIKEVFEKKIVTNRIKILQTYENFIKEYTLIWNYDIFLIDILLWQNKDKNGIDIIENIRKKNKSSPIIIVSWLDDITWLEKWFTKWANDYLVKPFRLKELELRVINWFKNYYYKPWFIQENKNYNWLEYNVLENNFYYKNQLLTLTKQSKFLLSILFQKPENLCTEEFLKDKMWLDIVSIIDRNLRINVLRLKQSLKPYNIDNWIVNSRGEWYMLKKPLN